MGKKTRAEILYESEQLRKETEDILEKYWDSIENQDIKRIAEAARDIDSLVDLYAVLHNESADLYVDGKLGTQEYQDKEKAIQRCAERIADCMLIKRGWESFLIQRFRKTK